MLLYMGDPDDLTGTYLVWLARRRGLEVETLAEEELGVSWSFAIRADGGISVYRGGEQISIAAVTGAIVRFNPEPRPFSRELPGTAAPSDDDTISHVVVSERRAGIQYFLDHVPFAVANRPSCGRENGSKPYQMRRLMSAGFQVPGWITTNSAEQATQFVSRQDDGCVVKSTSGLRSHVRKWSSDFHASFRKGTPPHVVQRYVTGHDVRVHVIGARAYGTRVESGSVDYRYDTEDAKYTEVEVPEATANLCVRYARRARLLIAGFDFRVSPEEVWFCLEMNPVPTFLPYEAATGQRIGDGLVDILAPGSRPVDDVSPLARRVSDTRSAVDRL